MLKVNKWPKGIPPSFIWFPGLQAELQSPARVTFTLAECSQQGSLYAECGIPPKCVDLQSVTCCKVSVCPEVSVHLKVCTTLYSVMTGSLRCTAQGVVSAQSVVETPAQNRVLVGGLNGLGPKARILPVALL